MVPQQYLRRAHHLCPWEALPLKVAEAAAPAEYPGEEVPTPKEVAALSMDAGLLQMQVLNFMKQNIYFKLACLVRKSQTS
jgi:hypothetical protein